MTFRYPKIDSQVCTREPYSTADGLQLKRANVRRIGTTYKPKPTQYSNIHPNLSTTQKLTLILTLRYAYDFLALFEMSLIGKPYP